MLSNHDFGVVFHYNHALLLQEVPHTRVLVGPEKPEVRTEQELHRAVQQNNMAYLDYVMTDNMLQTI